MTDDSEKPPDPTAARIRVWMARKGWGHNEAAQRLGIPPGTLGNWMQGTKRPSAAVIRLVEVLSVVEALAPHLFDALTAKRTP